MLKAGHARNTRPARFAANWQHLLFEGLALGRMTMDLAANEVLQVHFAPVVELLAYPRELVRPGLCHQGHRRRL